MPKPDLGPGLAAICAGTLLAGCFNTSAVIPDDWPEQVVLQGDDCPVIDGTYRNAGEKYEQLWRHDYSRYERSLAHILNGGTGHRSLELWNRLGPTTEIPSEDGFQSVSLRLAAGQLQVTASDAAGGERTVLLPVKARCRDSVIALDIDWGRYVLFPGFDDDNQVGHISIALGRAEDGSLLVREKEAGSYFFLFTPIAGYRDEAWTRFEEAPTTVVVAGSS